LEINSSSSVMLNGDLVVHGEAMCKKLIALTRVDAGTGMSIGASGLQQLASIVGLPGGNAGLVVHGTGGIGVGLPAAIPGSITCVGPITSYTTMSAPISSSIVSGSILKSDLVNSTIRKISNLVAGPYSVQPKPPELKA
jgi:hypothetical protein